MDILLLATCLVILLIIYKGQDNMSDALDRLTTEVAETRSAVDSAVTLISGLAEQIRDLKDDPAALEALADDLDAQQADIAAAVAANSEPPAEPPVE